MIRRGTEKGDDFMTNTNAVNFHRNCSEYFDQAVLYQDVIHVSTEHGNAVVLSEEEYRGLVETVYLLSVPGMKDQLLEGIRTPVEECDPFEW